MRAVVQRVAWARVRVDGEVVGRIGPGLCVLLGVTHTDDLAVAEGMAARIWHLRILPDEAGVMNRSVAEVTAGTPAGDPPPGILVVSQFTLYGDTGRGRRPSWIAAARPEVAEPLVEAVVARLGDLGATVATGRFRTEMEVELLNQGPVTLILDHPAV